jgi:hypothetical protein
VGAGGRNDQALYAHMNNKIKKQNKNKADSSANEETEHNILQAI